MTSTDIVPRQPGQLAKVPEGARALGQRVKPIIRLGMGVKDAERGFPKKTDYFTVRGDEKAVAKFNEVYGKPKAVRIMVPSELGLALDISYRSFIGGGEDGDGRPLALGMTNFATLGYVGGPDVLRVWKQDGSYAEVETLGLDELGKPLDEIANDLKIEVHTTFTFTIPDVLGWGSFAAVTSKGKKSADNLAYKLAQIYSAFGSKAPFAFSPEEPPMLVLKPDTAMVRFEKDGVAKWGKTSIFVLDIVIPEAFDKMVDRLALRQEQIAPAGAAAALYAPREIEPPPEVPPPGENGEGQGAAEVGDEAKQEPSSSSETDGTAAPAPTAEPEPGPNEPIEEGQFTVPESAKSDDPHVLAGQQAAEFEIPIGKWKGRKLSEMLDEGEQGLNWIRWCLRNYETDPLKTKAWEFARIFAPDVYEAVTAEKEAAS